MSDTKRYANLRELRQVVGYEWRTRRAWFSKRAMLRGLWWTFVRRYPSELCNCGRPVAAAIGGTYWHAADELWAQVMCWPGWREDLGEMVYLGPPGTRCPRCFTEAARRKGLYLYWEPRVDSRAP